MIDDSFLQPEPGTSAGDHLAGGLLQVAILAAAAFAYARVRAGLRATLALCLGVVGVMVGTEAAYYTREVGPSGDDYTGLLAILAGLVLIGSGLTLLWRTRKRDGSRTRRYLRRALMAGAAAVVAIFAVQPLAVSYVGTHAARAVVPSPELGAAHEDVGFTTSDGLRLVGWYVPSRNGAALIAFPGRSGPQDHARMLVRNGYGVLLFDRRGEGESEGDPNQLGWAGERDLDAAVAHLRARDDVDASRIGGIGLSVGGELLLQAAADSTAIRAVVSEGAGIRSTREAQEVSGNGLTKLRYLWSAATATAATMLFANDLPPANLKDLVPRIAPRPVFLIHAGNGEGGAELNETYFAAAGRPKAIWKIPDASHTEGITTRPEEYEQRVVGFFDQALLGKGG